MRFQRLIILLITVLLLGNAPVKVRAAAYKEETHALLTTLAFRRSILSQSTNQKTLDLLAGMGIKSLTFDKLPNWQGDKRTIVELLRDGAVLEDDGRRALNHFFNPRTGKNLPAAPLLNYTSPSWMLEDQEKIYSKDSAEQEFSYKVARKSFFTGLTANTEEEREKALGRMFQSLGNVLHHLQDMAQPQHSRVDSHLDAVIFKLDTRLTDLIAILRQRPSQLEYYTQQKYGGTSLKYWQELGERKFYIDGAAEFSQSLENFATTLETDLTPAYADGITIDNLIAAGKLTKPRDFWHTTQATDSNPAISGFGIAEFANRNFFTPGTLPGDAAVAKDQLSYPQVEGSSKDVDISTLFGKSKFPSVNPFSGEMTFYSSDVIETLLPITAEKNEQALAESFFSEYLQKANQPPFYVLNRFTYDEGQRFLLPRAVAYSGLMLDYFFRGELKVTIVPDKENTIKVQNLKKELLDGELAIYYENLDGKRLQVPGASWSKRLDSFDPANSDAGIDLTFIPPADLDPTKEGKYLLVFNGAMGAEKSELCDDCPGAIAFTEFQLNSVPSGVLYLAGLDKDGREIHFKVSEQGTQVLQNEFDPIPFGIQFLGDASTNYRGGSPHTKQVTYSQSAGQSSYKVKSFTLDACYPGTLFSPRYCRFISYALKADQSAYERIGTSSGISWIAESNDPNIGRFSFFLERCYFENRSSCPELITYTRTYKDVNGQTKTQTGSLPLPPLIIEGKINNNYSGLRISADGLTLYRTANGDPVMTGQSNYPSPSGDGSYSGSTAAKFYLATYKINMIPTPTFSIEIEQSGFAQDTYRGERHTNKIISTVTKNSFIPEQNCKPLVIEIPIKENKEERFGSNSSDVTSIIGFGRSGPIRFRRNAISNTEYLSINATGNSFYLNSCPSTENFAYSFQDFEFNNPVIGKEEYTLPNGSVTFNSRNLWPEENRQLRRCDFVLCREFRKETAICDGLISNPASQKCKYSSTAYPPPFPYEYVTVRPLTDKIQDALISRSTLAEMGTSESTVQIFRGVSLGQKPAIWDTSPNGEVFLATTDMSVIFYGARRSIAIPPGIVRLTTAVWL